MRILSCIILIALAYSVNSQIKPKTTSDIRIRDPFIYADSLKHTYYMYASGSNRSEAGGLGVEVYKSKDLQTWTGPSPVFIVTPDFWGNRKVWAPEVHAYQGKYYLFVTFTSNKEMKPIDGRPKIENRATQILVSDSPEGPFKPFANQPQTPDDWMSLDGTFWIENGTPYMIFCHEWIQITDGTIELTELKKDLSEAIGRPQTLFSATHAQWARSLDEVGVKHDNKSQKGYITDGPFLYRTKNGKLLMIWSSFGVEKYAVGLAESQTGSIKGPWKIIQEPLFRANGGHGMIFKTFDGQLKLVLHQPNNSPMERAHLFDLEDTGNIIRIKQ